MAVQVELWEPLIIEGLYKANPHLRYAYNADSNVIAGRIVHIPQAGSPSPVERNRALLPAPIAKRNDTDITYVLDEYTVDPVLIPNADLYELSYDKRVSVVNENTANLKEFVGDDILYKWAKEAPAANKILSTGAAAAATASGATGNRKIMTEADIRAAKKLLDKQNVPKEDRFLMISPDHLDHLLSDDKLKYAYQQVVDLPAGVIMRYAGFNILERSSVLRQTTGGTAGAVKLPEAAAATSDDDCAFFWHQNVVERAMGDVKMFQNMGVAEYYGDIYSFLVRMGGRNRRQDHKGYGLIVMAA